MLLLLHSLVVPDAQAETTSHPTVYDAFTHSAANYHPHICQCSCGIHSYLPVEDIRWPCHGCDIGVHTGNFVHICYLGVHW